MNLFTRETVSVLNRGMGTPRDRINDFSVAEDVVWIELGYRVFMSMSAENNDRYRYIQGVSELFYRTDDSDDWSDIIAMAHLDHHSDFTLIQGLRLMVAGVEPHTAIKWLEAWERREPIDWKHEEWARADAWETWVSNGGLDNED